MDNDAKLRPLYLGKILYERTDEDNSLTTNQLISILKEEYHISSHRQTIATEIELLKDFGMDIECVKSRQNKYHLVVYIDRTHAQEIRPYKNLVKEIDKSF